MTVDTETLRYAEIIKAKQDRLFLLDRQAAMYGIDVPPHIEMERGSLRDELLMMETAIASPARGEVSDELGVRGRFVVNHQQNREIKESIAAVLVKLNAFITDSDVWRNQHRLWIIVTAITTIIIFGFVVAIVTYLITSGLH